jgi:ribosomal protein S18 acetylase RimI-like enzyme
MVAESRTTASITVRPARREDIDEITQVLERAYIEFAAIFSWPEMWDLYFADVTRVASRWDHTRLLVAESEGIIVGSVDYYPPEGEEGHVRPELHDVVSPEVIAKMTFPSGWAAFRCLGTDPARRGHGIGRTLVSAVIELARQEGALHVGLHSIAIMTAAIRMYERLGFTRYPERDFTPTNNGVVVPAYQLHL